MTLPLLALIAACGTSDPASAEPAAGPVREAPVPGDLPVTEAPPGETRHRLAGTVEAIRLQNINKAKGRFTYQVELGVRVASVEPVPEPWTRMKPPPKRVQVRVDPGLHWAKLNDAERAALAPDGPKPTLLPTTYGSWTVGESAELVVRFSGPELAHLEP